MPGRHWRPGIWRLLEDNEEMSTLVELFTRPGIPNLVLAPAIDLDDPREQIEVGVLMANGRLAPRNFSSRAEAEAWAQPGEEVVEWNAICGCDR